MKVSELIEKLRLMPQDHEVRISGDEGTSDAVTVGIWTESNDISFVMIADFGEWWDA